MDVKPEELIVHGHKPQTIDIGGRRIMGAPDEIMPESADYRGTHAAPMKSEDLSTAPGHELNKVYPEDIYGPNGYRYYGHGDWDMDKDTLQLMSQARDNPEHSITIYRAVPAEFKDTEINPGDWVTPNLDYAHQHARRFDDYHVLEKTVPAKHIWNDANSIHEYGYDPN